jgi:hypothetical protein
LTLSAEFVALHGSTRRFKALAIVLIAGNTALNTPSCEAIAVTFLPRPDNELESIECAIRAIAGYEETIRECVAEAIDEMVDPIGSGRWSIDQLTRFEKAALGIRVANTLRMGLGLQRGGPSTAVVEGTNVGIRFTITSNWLVPPEFVEQVLLVTRFDPQNLRVWAGLQRARSEWLNRGHHNGVRRGFNRTGRDGIRWLVTTVIPQSSGAGFLALGSNAVCSELSDSSVAGDTLLIPAPSELANSWHPEQATYRVLRWSSPEDQRLLRDRGLPPLPKGFCMSIDLP